MQIKEMIQAVKGELCNQGKIKKSYNKIKTDTRTLQKNDIFIALSGKNFDGHHFISEAIAKKAALIMIEKEMKIPDTTIPIVRVPSTEEALFQIANLYLNKYRPPVIAITGSTGKTTTKDLLALILSKKYKVLKSQGNKNNHIGVPQTIFELKATHDLVIVELGMNHEYEIERLSKLVKPSISLITNIGTSHIGNLGSIENIKKAKLEITAGMQDGILIVNGEDPNLQQLPHNPKITVQPVGLKNDEFSFLEIHSNLDGSTYLLKHQNCYYKGIVELYGEKLFLNLALAIKTALLLGVEMEDIVEALKEYHSPEKRMNIRKYHQYIIIDDCYNASFESLMANLQFLEECKEHKLVILGDILELGHKSAIIHQNIGKILKNKKNIDVILVGKEMLYAKENCPNASYFSNNQEVITYLQKNPIQTNTIIYFKGSRKMHLEEIIQELFPEGK